jgi:HSP20 family protein
MERHKELMTTEPGAWMRKVFREFDRFFDERALPFFRPRWRAYGEFPWMPELEMFERDHRLIVRVDLPGLAREDVTIEVIGGGLTISGERKHETREERPGWYSSERTYGRFYRAVPLREGVNAGEITATFTNGVLEVTIPTPAKPVAPATYKVPIDGTTEKKAGTAAA